MKKLCSWLLVLALAAGALAGCGSQSGDDSKKGEDQTTQEQQEQKAEPVDVNIAALKGPTAMGMVKFMDDVDKGEVDDENYNFQIAASNTEAGAGRT